VPGRRLSRDLPEPDGYNVPLLIVVNFERSSAPISLRALHQIHRGSDRVMLSGIMVGQVVALFVGHCETSRSPEMEVISSHFAKVMAQTADRNPQPMSA
jgi:hypothetical protein